MGGYLSPNALQKENVVASAVDNDEEEIKVIRKRRPSPLPMTSGTDDSEEVFETDNPEGDSTPVNIDLGGPFSALTPSMQPSRDVEEDESLSDDNVHYDEFGFRIEVEDSPEDDRPSGPQISPPVADNPQLRLKWIAHLEFAQSGKDGCRSDVGATSKSREPKKGHRYHSGSNGGEQLLAWETMVEGITRTKKLR